MDSIYRCSSCGFRGSLDGIKQHQCNESLAGGQRKITATLPVAGLQNVRLPVNQQNPFSSPFPQAAGPPSGPVGAEAVIHFHCKFHCGHFATSWEEIRRHEQTVHASPAVQPIAMMQVPGSPMPFAGAPRNATPQSGPQSVSPPVINGTSQFSGAASTARSGEPSTSPPPPVQHPLPEGVGFIPFSRPTAVASPSPTPTPAPQPATPPVIRQPVPVPMVAAALPTEAPEAQARMFTPAPVPVARVPTFVARHESEPEEDEDEEASMLPLLLTVVGPAAAAFLAVVLCMPFLEGSPEWPAVSLNLGLPGFDFDLFDFNFTSDATSDPEAEWSILWLPRQVFWGLLAVPGTVFGWLTRGGGSVWDFTKHSILENILWLLWTVGALIANIIQVLSLLSRRASAVCAALMLCKADTWNVMVGAATWGRFVLWHWTW